MGNVSLWTYSVILLCLGGTAFSQRFPCENPSTRYRNAPSKLNIRNFLGSKLVQRLADNQNQPQYEPYDRQMPNHPLYDHLVAPPPTQYVPPSFWRGSSYESQNQRIPPPSPPLPMGATQNMETQRRVISPPPPQMMDSPPPHAMGSLPPPHAMNIPPPRTTGPPPPHEIGPPMDQPPRAMAPPPQHLDQTKMHENVYTETITSSCPCFGCGSCSECEAAGQDYAYQEESCPCCSERCPCEECPCNCEECPCYCKEKDYYGGKCSCSVERCPCYDNDSSYPSDKKYSDSDQNYDDYLPSDCPCCFECSGSQDCPCNYHDEPQSPHPSMERPGYRGYPRDNLMNENEMEGPTDTHIQRHSESYVTVMGSPSYKPMPMPPREMPEPRYSQYEEPLEPPPHVKMPPRRTYVPQPIPKSDMPPPVMHHAPVSELPEEPMHHYQHRHHVPELPERIMQHPPIPEAPERTMHHTEINERTVHRYHEPAPPMQMQPVEPFPMQHEGPRRGEWRQVSQIPPSGPGRHMMEKEPPPMEPQVPMYRSYQPMPRFSRKYRQPTKPAFFEGLSYSEAC